MGLGNLLGRCLGITTNKKHDSENNLETKQTCTAAVQAVEPPPSSPRQRAERWLAFLTEEGHNDHESRSLSEQNAGFHPEGFSDFAGLLNGPDPLVLLEFVGIPEGEDDQQEQPRALRALHLDIDLRGILQHPRELQEAQVSDLHTTYVDCSAIRLSARHANAALRSLLHCPTARHYEALLADLLSSDPLLLTALKDSFVALLEDCTTASCPPFQPSYVGGGSGVTPGPAHPLVAHPLVVHHTLPGCPSRALLPITLHPLILRRRTTHRSAAAAAASPGPVSRSAVAPVMPPQASGPGSDLGRGATRCPVPGQPPPPPSCQAEEHLVAAVVLRYSLSAGIGVMQEQLHRCLAALSGLPSCVTLLSGDGGRVLYQNAASVSYMGLRQGAAAAGVAAAAVADPRVLMITAASTVTTRAAEMAAAAGARRGGAAAAGVGAGAGASEGEGAVGTGHGGAEAGADVRSRGGEPGRRGDGDGDFELRVSAFGPSYRPSSGGCGGFEDGSGGGSGGGGGGGGGGVLRELFTLSPLQWQEVGRELLARRPWKGILQVPPLLTRQQQLPYNPAAAAMTTAEELTSLFEVVAAGAPVSGGGAGPQMDRAAPQMGIEVGATEVPSRPSSAPGTPVLECLDGSWEEITLLPQPPRLLGQTERSTDPGLEGDRDAALASAMATSAAASAPASGGAAGVSGGSPETALGDRRTSACTSSSQLPALVPPLTEPAPAPSLVLSPGAGQGADWTVPAASPRMAPALKLPSWKLLRGADRSTVRDSDSLPFMPAVPESVSWGGSAPIYTSTLASSRNSKAGMEPDPGDGSTGSCTAETAGTAVETAAHLFTSGLRGVLTASTEASLTAAEEGCSVVNSRSVRWVRQVPISGDGMEAAAVRQGIAAHGAHGRSSHARLLDGYLYSSLPDRRGGFTGGMSHRMYGIGAEEAGAEGPLSAAAGSLGHGGAFGRGGLNSSIRQSIERRRTAMGVLRQPDNPLSTSTWALVTDGVGGSGAGGKAISRRHTSFGAAVLRAGGQLSHPLPGELLLAAASASQPGPFRTSRSGTGIATVTTVACSSPASVPAVLEGGAARGRPSQGPRGSQVQAAALGPQLMPSEAPPPGTAGGGGGGDDLAATAAVAAMAMSSSPWTSASGTSTAAVTSRPPVLPAASRPLPCSLLDRPTSGNVGDVHMSVDAAAGSQVLLPGVGGCGTEVEVTGEPEEASTQAMLSSSQAPSTLASPRPFAATSLPSTLTSPHASVAPSAALASTDLAAGKLLSSSRPPSRLYDRATVAPAAVVLQVTAGGGVTGGDSGGNGFFTSLRGLRSVREVTSGPSGFRTAPCTTTPAELSRQLSAASAGTVAGAVAPAAPAAAAAAAATAISAAITSGTDGPGGSGGVRSGGGGGGPSDATHSRGPVRTAATIRRLAAPAASTSTRCLSPLSLSASVLAASCTTDDGPASGLTRAASRATTTDFGGVDLLRGRSSPLLGRQPTGGGEEEEDGGCWHEVTITPLAAAAAGASLLVMQTDVTARVRAERSIAKVLEAEHQLLESIFPRHVLEHAAASARKGADREVGPAQYRLGRLPLAQDSASIATYHPMVTVLFADIKGFTSLCHAIPATSVMQFLNDLYSRLDTLLDVYGVYKVETIGDCYMVAGGLMVRDADGFMTVRGPDSVDDLHAAKTMAFAKAMLREASQVTLPTTIRPVEMRIGLHSGPVMSGIVGSKMPRFCLFGDTVNTASRMESTCTPGCIHVSATTRSYLGDEEWEPTGGVQVKGIGIMSTYHWVDTSEDGRRSSQTDKRATAAMAGTAAAAAAGGLGSARARARRASSVVVLSSTPSTAAFAAAHRRSHQHQQHQHEHQCPPMQPNQQPPRAGSHPDRQRQPQAPEETARDPGPFTSPGEGTACSENGSGPGGSGAAAAQLPHGGSMAGGSVSPEAFQGPEGRLRQSPGGRGAGRRTGSRLRVKRSCTVMGLQGFYDGAGAGSGRASVLSVSALPPLGSTTESQLQPLQQQHLVQQPQMQQQQQVAQEQQIQQKHQQQQT